MDLSEINNRIRLVITQANLTQALFAKKIGSKQQDISKAMANKHKPSIGFITQILVNFPEISVNRLILGQGDMLKNDVLGYKKNEGMLIISDNPKNYSCMECKKKQIDFQKHSIFIPKDIAKKRTARIMDIPQQLFDTLIEHGISRLNKEMFVIGPTGRPGFQKIGLNTLRERFNQFRDRFGMTKDYKWYSFKHTGAGKLLESGASIVEVMRQLGHTDITSTYHYIKRHFGERSEHVLNKFPSPPGLNRPKKVNVNWLEGICTN